MKEQQFEIRAVIVGKGLWACPDCGHTHRLHLTPKSRWRVRCTYEDCGSVFRVGLIFHRQGNGQGRTGRPPDTIMGQGMPEGDLAPEPYKRGKPVHRVKTAQFGRRDGPSRGDHGAGKGDTKAGAEGSQSPGFKEGIQAGLEVGSN